MGFPHSSAGKESARSVGDLGLIPRSGRSPEEGKGNRLINLTVALKPGGASESFYADYWALFQNTEPESLRQEPPDVWFL